MHINKGRLELYICTVYDRIFGEFLPKMPYIHHIYYYIKIYDSGQPYTKHWQNKHYGHGLLPCVTSIPWKSATCQVSTNVVKNLLCSFPSNLRMWLTYHWYDINHDPPASQQGWWTWSPWQLPCGDWLQGQARASWDSAWRSGSIWFGRHVPAEVSKCSRLVQNEASAACLWQHSCIKALW